MWPTRQVVVVRTTWPPIRNIGQLVKNRRTTARWPQTLMVANSSKHQPTSWPLRDDLTTWPPVKLKGWPSRPAANSTPGSHASKRRAEWGWPVSNRQRPRPLRQRRPGNYLGDLVALYCAGLVSVAPGTLGVVNVRHDAD